MPHSSRLRALDIGWKDSSNRRRFFWMAGLSGACCATVTCAGSETAADLHTVPVQYPQLSSGSGSLAAANGGDRV